MVWTRENPGAGDCDSIHAAGQMRAELAARLIGHTGVYLEKSDESLATMSADTITAVRGVLASVSPDVSRLADELQAHADALKQYAFEVDEIRQDAAVLTRDEDDAQSDLLRAQLAVDDLSSWLSPVTPVLTAEQDEERTALQGRVAIAEDELAGLARRRDELVERRRNADLVCAYRLTTGISTSSAVLASGDARAIVDGTSLVAVLSQMTAAQLAAYLKANPSAARYLRDLSPEQVNEFWRAIGNPDGTRSAAQLALVAATPDVIGNLGGIAYWARDLANREQLTRAIEQAREEGDHARLESLEAIQKALAPRNGVPRRLTVFLNEKNPLAAVSVGDLDTAETVTYDVPGMNTSANDMPGWARAAQNLYDEQGAAGGNGPRAVVAWIGYDAPPVPFDGNIDFGVARGEYARAGAERFTDELAGYNATRQDRAVELNVVAHSYGTTTVADALAAADLDVDVLVLLGSAGIEAAVGDASGLHVDHVYAAQAQDVIPIVEAGLGDEWAGVGRDLSSRLNPVSPEFGAIVFGVDGEGIDSDLGPVTAHDPLLPLGTESGAGYLDRKTESLRNVAYATTGQPAELTEYVKPALTPLERGFLTPGRGYGYYDGTNQGD